MEEPKERQLKLLLVDDSDDDALMLRLALRDAESLHLIDHLEDGDMVVDYLQNRPGGLPDLMLLDINMPRKNGLQVLRELKAHPEWKGLPVVILSTSTRERDVRDSYHLGANSFVSKPDDRVGFRKLITGLCSYWGHLARVPDRDIPDLS